MEARASSVFGSNMTRVGRRRPTQTVTIRPLVSKVIEPQSALWNVEARRMPRPSGPGPRLASVWKASLWRLLRSFGAIKGWRGTSGTEIGCWIAGDTENNGGGLLLEPSGIGIALAAVAVAPATASKSTNRLRSRRRRVSPTIERLPSARGPSLRFPAPRGRPRANHAGQRPAPDPDPDGGDSR